MLKLLVTLILLIRLICQVVEDINCSTMRKKCLSSFFMMSQARKHLQGSDFTHDLDLNVIHWVDVADYYSTTCRQVTKNSSSLKEILTHGLYRVLTSCCCLLWSKSKFSLHFISCTGPLGIKGSAMKPTNTLVYARTVRLVTLPTNTYDQTQ